jgi:hypothetical protein
MNDKFDELAKGLAQSATRRQALKKFGSALAGLAMACFGLADRAEAGKGGCKPAGAKCVKCSQCCSGDCYSTFYYGGPRFCR